MKRWFYLFVICLGVFLPSLSFAKDADVSTVLRIFDFPLYSSPASDYSVSVNYTFPESCLECVTSFFTTELRKKGWEVKEQKYDQELLKNFLNLKKELAATKEKEKGKGVFPLGVDAKSAEYIIANEKSITDEIKKNSPVVIEAIRRRDNLSCNIYVRVVPGKGSALTITLSKK